MIDPAKAGAAPATATAGTVQAMPLTTVRRFGVMPLGVVVMNYPLFVRYRWEPPTNSYAESTVWVSEYNLARPCQILISR